MITVLNTIQLPDPMTDDEALQVFLGTAPKYRDVPGLLYKYYVLSDDRRAVGGFYVWESRAQAQGMYNGEWRAFVRQKYGAEPCVTYFDTPVVVDNVEGTIRSHAQA